MATLTFSFDTGSVPLSKINNAIAAEYDYQSTIDGEPNPESKAEFSKRMIKTVITNIVKNQDKKVARQAAEASVSEITLT